MRPLPPPSSHGPRDVRRFVLTLDRRLEGVDQAILRVQWDLFTGRSGTALARLELDRAGLLSDPRLTSWVRTARQRGAPAGIARRLELLERILLDTEVEQHPEVVRIRSELQRRIVAYRPRWKGRPVGRAVVQRVISQSPHRAERKRAYYAQDAFLRSLEPPLRRLVGLRNDRARALGYPNFAEMRLGFQGLSVGRVEELAEAALVGAPEVIRSERARFDEGTGESDWYPWDLAYARWSHASFPDRVFPVRSMMPRIFAAMRQWGFRPERARFRVVFHDLPAGGLTLAPDPPRDVRILVHPRGGWNAYEVMFHEVGHALHSANERSPRHLLRWHENVPGFGGIREGIGGLFEEVPRSVEWLSAQPGVSTEQATRFAELRRRTDAVRAASLSSWIRRELALYRDPEKDPGPAEYRRERRLHGYDAFRPRSFADAFYVDTPVYSANYLLALLVQHQLAHTLRDRFGEPLWPNPRVGPWLVREWFASGSLYDWVPRMRTVTGRPFGARAFRESLAAS